MKPTPPRGLAGRRARPRRSRVAARRATVPTVARGVLVAALLLSGPALAQESSAGRDARSVPAPAAPERLGVVGIAGRAGGPESAGPADVGGLGLATRFGLGGRWGVGLELWPLLLWRQAPPEGSGRETVPSVAAAGLLTFDAGPAAGRWRIRLEAGVGPMWASEPVPARGSRWNFFNEEGVRFLWPLRDGSLGSLGYRFVHVSNGRSSGAENPGLNVHAVVVGWAFR